jgi:hypothetical protein
MFGGYADCELIVVRYHVSNTFVYNCLQFRTIQIRKHSRIDKDAKCKGDVCGL